MPATSETDGPAQPTPAALATFRCKIRCFDAYGVRRLAARRKRTVDLTSFIVLEELAIRHVITGDSHFRRSEFGLIKIP